MPIKADAKSKVPTVPPGTHTAVCYGVVAVGTQVNPNSNFKPAKKVVLLWELPDERAEFDGKDKPRGVSKKYTLSLGDRATLRKDLESWRGRAFTEQELAGFDIDKLIGANCLLNIVHGEKNGRTFANIAGVVPLPKGMTKRALENHPLYFNLEESLEAAQRGDGVVEFPANMPEWLVEVSKASVEYQDHLQVKDHEAAPDEEAGGEPVSMADALKEVPF